jgi:hypothetical protein
MKTTPLTPEARAIPRKVTISLIVGWIVIVAKCAFAPVVMHRWHVPIDPGWVIVPTLVFAVLITALVLTHDWSRDAED